MADKKHRLRFKLSWQIIGLALVAFVIQASLTSNPVKVDVIYFDKYAHTAGYFVLMGWFVQIYQTRLSVNILAVLFIFMGIGIEFVQGMTGYRYFDIYDMLANSLGVILAWLLSKTVFADLLYYFERHFLRRLKSGET